MTDPAPSPDAAPRPVPHRSMPTLGHGVHWPAIVAEIDRDQQRRTADLRDAVRDTVAEVFEVPREMVEPPPTASSAGKSACSHGTADGAYCWPCAQRDRGKELRAYAAPVEAPPAIELLAMADDLNAHGGLDERFVAGLLKQVTVDDAPESRLSQWLMGEFVAHVNDGVDKAAVLDAMVAAANQPSEHQHIWTTTSPMRCVECRRYLRPWWRRTLDRVRRWGQ